MWSLRENKKLRGEVSSRITLSIFLFRLQHEPPEFEGDIIRNYSALN